MDKKQFAVGILLFFSLCDLAQWAMRSKYPEFTDTGMRVAQAASSFVFGIAWYLVGLWQFAPLIWSIVCAVIWLGITTWHVVEIWDKK